MTSGPDAGKFIVPYDGTYQIYTTNLNRNSGKLKLNLHSYTFTHLEFWQNLLQTDSYNSLSFEEFGQNQ